MTLMIFSSLWEAIRGCGLCRGFWANGMGGKRERQTKAGKEGKKFCPCLCVSGEEDGVQCCLK